MIYSFYERVASLQAFWALVSGVLLALSFPKSGLSGLAYIAFLPLFFSLDRNRNKIPVFFSGMVTGFFYNLLTIYWITLTMENYGGVPKSLSLCVLLIFSLYLSLFVGVFAYGVGRFLQSATLFLWGTPFLWVALEYARAHLLTGFPWELLGYSQYLNLPVIQISDLTGVYGVSFLIILVNCGLFLALTGFGSGNGVRRQLVPLACVILCLVGTLLYGANRLREIRSGTIRSKIRVSVVQGNIQQDRKWDPKYRSRILSIYARLSQKAGLNHPDLIIWPEAAVPFYFMMDRPDQARLLTLIDDLGVDLLFGGPDVRLKNGKEDYFNSAFLVSPAGRLRGRYDKIHLVPFGEYVPLRRALFFVHPIIDQIGDMKPGDGISLMRTDKGSCGTPICFEIVFPDLVRRFVRDGADFIATLTNDDWFGRSSAPYQHFSMAVFRAVENRVPVVRAANSGISGVIAPDGRVVKRTGIFQEDVFTEDLDLADRPLSFYTRFGDLFAWVCVIGAFLCLAGTYRRSGREEKRNDP